MAPLVLSSVPWLYFEFNVSCFTFFQLVLLCVAITLHARFLTHSLLGLDISLAEILMCAASGHLRWVLRQALFVWSATTSRKMEKIWHFYEVQEILLQHLNVTHQALYLGDII